METKFTPGPWGFRIDHEVGSIGTPDKLTAMAYPCEETGYVTDEGRANAHLISAAPDMYEALTNAAKDIEIRIRRGLAEEGHTAAGIADIVDTCPALIGVRAALSKARGES